MSEKIKFKRRDEVIFREEDEVGLLFDPENGRVDILNGTGKFIWSSLGKEKSRVEMVDEVMAEFDIADKEKCRDDIDLFVSSMGRAGLLKDYVEAPKFPGSVCFAITSKCNFSCKHCLNRNIALDGADMTLDELMNVIDQLGQGEVRNVSIFGGEPLCHPDFKRIVEHMNKYSMNISLNTNGSLIDDDIARWLKIHKVSGAVVSFDGSSAPVMDEMRGSGAFEMSLKGIRALRGAGISVLLSVTLTKLNFKFVRDMVLLGKEIEGSAIRFNHVFFGGNAACFIKELYLEPAEEREAIDAVWRAKEEFGAFVSDESSYLCQKRKLEDTVKYKPVNDKITVRPCGAAMAKCAIRPDGWVVPCEILWDVKCGNVKEDKLKDIWENSQLLNTFRRPLEVDLEKLPECKGCQYQYMCFLGHRCYPYHYPGGVYNRALYCWLEKKGLTTF